MQTISFRPWPGSFDGLEDDFYAPDYPEIIPFEEMALEVEENDKVMEDMEDSSGYLTFDELAKAVENTDATIPILKKFHEFF